MLSKLILLLAAAVFCFTTAHPQSQWQLVKSTDGKFSVSMPCKPEIEIEPEDLETKTPKGTLYGCTLGNAHYLITYTDFEVMATDRPLLDVYVEGVTNNSTLISKKRLPLGRIPGYELMFTSCDKEGGPPMIFKWRVYQTGKRIYAVTSTSQDPIRDTTNVSRFMASFAILP